MPHSFGFGGSCDTDTGVVESATAVAELSDFGDVMFSSFDVGSWGTSAAAGATSGCSSIFMLARASVKVIQI